MPGGQYSGALSPNRPWRFIPVLVLISSLTACSPHTSSIPPQIPDNPIVHLAEASDYLSKGQCQRALDLYNKAIPKIEHQKGVAPVQLAELLYYQGVSHMCLKNYAAAQQSFERALGVEPLYHPAKNSLGILHIELGDYAEAERIFLDLLKVADYPQSAVYFNLARLYVKEGEWTRAIFVARKAVELAPDKLGPRILFAQILEHLGMKRDAIIQYRLVVKSWPNNLESIYHLAKLYSRQGHHCEAKKLYLRILELDPVGAYAEEATVKLQTLPCDEILQIVPPRAPHRPKKEKKPSSDSAKATPHS